ncbi:MAG: DUF169 domain-containing protein [Acidobacteria bacterium]|nr:DUF169 domain-containing protein [Acidobacteriota bacterium]
MPVEQKPQKQQSTRRQGREAPPQPPPLAQRPLRQRRRIRHQIQHQQQQQANHTTEWGALSSRLTAALKLAAAPIAIRFHADAGEAGAERRAGDYPPPNARGRTGQVPAGCVFWMEAANGTFSTAPADHANCSVGSLTHGLIGLEEAATRDDVEAVLGAGWVDEAAVLALPVVSERPAAIVYGPLGEVGNDENPDVVLLRLNGRALMTLRDTFPDMAIEGKPQCHIVAMAKEQGRVAASVGCALSRTRTGMRPEEMTAVIPGARLAGAVDALEATVALNGQMASYAAADARRFTA